MIQSDEKVNKFGKVNVEQKARNFLAKVNKNKGRRWVNRNNFGDLGDETEQVKTLDMGSNSLAEPSTDAAIYVTVRNQRPVDDDDAKKKLPALKNKKKPKNDETDKDERNNAFVLSNLLDHDRMIMAHAHTKSSSKNIFSHNNLNQPIYLSPAKISLDAQISKAQQSEEDFLRSKLHIRRKPVKLKPLLMSMPDKLTMEATDSMPNAATTRTYQYEQNGAAKESWKTLYKSKHASKPEATPVVPFLVFKDLNEDNLFGLQTPGIDSEEYENMQIRRRNGGKVPEIKPLPGPSGNRTLLAKKLINLKLNDQVNHAKPEPLAPAKKPFKLAEFEPLELDKENNADGGDNSDEAYNSWPNEPKYYEQKNNPISKENFAKPVNVDVSLKALNGKFRPHDYSTRKCAEWLTKHVYKYYEGARKSDQNLDDINSDPASYWK